jgi:hypothetical protein
MAVLPFRRLIPRTSVSWPLSGTSSTPCSPSWKITTPLVNPLLLVNSVQILTLMSPAEGRLVESVVDRLLAATLGRPANAQSLAKKIELLAMIRPRSIKSVAHIVAHKLKALHAQQSPRRASHGGQ